MNVHQPVTAAAVEEEDFFLMANLRPKNTGLPMTVWVSHRGHARHDARVKVCRAHGDYLDVNNLAVVGIRPKPSLIEGPLKGSDFKLVEQWIEINEAVLIGFWDGTLDTVELLEGLKQL